jgi:Cft2 family RNA processing exonuclease
VSATKNKKRGGRKSTHQAPLHPNITFSPKHGVHADGTVLWMDGFPPHGLGFVSHAHRRVTLAHAKTAKIVTTQTTAALAGLAGPNVLTTPYDRRFSIGKLDLELFPSGHVPGAAALWLRWEENEMLYAGSINPTGELGAEPCGLRRAEILVIESTYGNPAFAFPPPEQTLAQLCTRIQTLISDGRIPVVLVSHPAGKAQAIASRLHNRGVTVWAHRRICEAGRCLRDLGRASGAPRRLKPERAQGGAVLWLLASRKAPSLQKLSAPRFIAVSGEVCDPGFTARYAADEGFVLSDHADFRTLVRYIDSVEARRVVLLPGRAHTLAAHIRKGRRNVEVLEPSQLSMF